jgi:hypothetical protein
VDPNGVPNELYEAAQLYLGARCLATVPGLHLHKAHGAPEAVASLPDDHAACDTFRGVRVEWTSWGAEAAGGGTAYSYSPFGGRRGRFGGPSYGSAGWQQRCLRLEFPRHHRDVVRGAHIDHVLAVAAALRLKMRERKLYTNNPSMYCGSGGMDDHRMLWSADAVVGVLGKMAFGSLAHVRPG